MSYSGSRFCSNSFSKLLRYFFSFAGASCSSLRYCCLVLSLGINSRINSRLNPLASFFSLEYPIVCSSLQIPLDVVFIACSPSNEVTCIATATSPGSAIRPCSAAEFGHRERKAPLSSSSTALAQVHNRTIYLILQISISQLLCHFANSLLVMCRLAPERPASLGSLKSALRLT